ncbi:hypothetical protein HK102_012665, partial [Quaeritorhiza haematococci]
GGDEAADAEGRVWAPDGVSFKRTIPPAPVARTTLPSVCAAKLVTRPATSGFDPQAAPTMTRPPSPKEGAGFPPESKRATAPNSSSVNQRPGSRSSPYGKGRPGHEDLAVRLDQDRGDDVVAIREVAHGSPQQIAERGRDGAPGPERRIGRPVGEIAREPEIGTAV